MAARPGPSTGRPLHVGRYLAALTAITALLAAVVLLGGPGSQPLTPRLGLDLQGGASVVLTPRTESGAAPEREQLQTAVEIIQRRVNGLGVAEAEVVTQGDNIVVSVPGGTRDSLRTLAQTAQLRFREVLDAAPGDPDAPVEPLPTAGPSAGPSGSADATPSAGASPRGRAATGGLLAQAPTAPAGPTPAPSPSAAAPRPPAEELRTGVPYSPAVFAALDCSDPAVRQGGGAEDPDAEIVACSADGLVKYHLAPARVVGTDVDGAEATLDQAGTAWTVNVRFTREGQDRFTRLTEATVGRNVAIVLDGLVLSAPTIRSRIDTSAEISGDFTRESARELANTLEYGALPLDFENSQVEVVSPTLGTDQLRSGLLAGGIGMLAVVVYSMLYYRALGTVVIASLAVAALLTYLSVAVLGELIGFALSLAGVAGLIVAIGITADSFVVYFERLKDEVQEGRSPRSAVDRGWYRARRTIISADVVSFLAAVILYFVSVGGVRGFAFTLGLTTLIDVLVVFLFTRPLVSLLSRYGWFSRRRWTGFVGPDGGEPVTGTTARTAARAVATEAPA